MKNEEYYCITCKEVVEVFSDIRNACKCFSFVARVLGFNVSLDAVMDGLKTEGHVDVFDLSIYLVDCEGNRIER